MQPLPFTRAFSFQCQNHRADSSSLLPPSGTRRQAWCCCGEHATRADRDLQDDVTQALVVRRGTMRRARISSSTSLAQQVCRPNWWWCSRIFTVGRGSLSRSWNCGAAAVRPVARARADVSVGALSTNEVPQALSACSLPSTWHHKASGEHVSSPLHWRWLRILRMLHARLLMF